MVVKFSIYLNRRVFVMHCKAVVLMSLVLCVTWWLLAAGFLHVLFCSSSSHCCILWILSGVMISLFGEGFALLSLARGLYTVIKVCLLFLLVSLVGFGM